MNDQEKPHGASLPAGPADDLDPAPAPAVLVDLRQEVRRGFLHVHDRLRSNGREAIGTLALAAALAELLRRKGLIDAVRLEAGKREAARRLAQESGEAPLTPVLDHAHEEDKYRFTGGVVIDCASRIPLCRASCCRLAFALSKQDVREGVVRWNLEVPYRIAQEPDRYCSNLDRGSSSCRVWEQRPITCRAYDCRRDARIWHDFEKRIPNPDLTRDDWPNCVEQNAT